MDQEAILKQLEKALAKKDDKELRLRVEVLVDILKESKPRFQSPIIPQPSQSLSPTTPILPREDVPTKSSPRVNGVGAISSVNSEQINYKRPKGT